MNRNLISMVLFFIFFALQAKAEENLTEITCDVVKKITSIRANKIIETYTTVDFYIDDLNQELLFAPSKKQCVSASKIFTNDKITLLGVPFLDNMGGNININRNSGAINMMFKNKNGNMTVQYSGRCEKVEKAKKF